MVLRGVGFTLGLVVAFLLARVDAVLRSVCTERTLASRLEGGSVGADSVLEGLGETVGFGEGLDAGGASLVGPAVDTVGDGAGEGAGSPATIAVMVPPQQHKSTATPTPTRAGLLTFFTKVLSELDWNLHVLAAHPSY